VLVPDPGFPIYPSMARFCGGVPVGYGLDARNAPDVDDLEARSARGRASCCSTRPTTPTGGALDAARRARVALVAVRTTARRHRRHLLALVYDGGRAPTAAACDAARDRTLLVDGFSKTYAMTGYRLGYLVAPRPWMAALTTLAINGHTCVPPFVQRAGVAALAGPQDVVATQREAYRARRDLLVAGLNAIPGVRCPTPAGRSTSSPTSRGCWGPAG
jgi:aspartate/methionine/tyrosine aminotransferase